MAVVRMSIDKFGPVPVQIDEDHPLAIAQRAKNAAAAAAKPGQGKTRKAEPGPAEPAAG